METPLVLLSEATTDVPVIESLELEDVLPGTKRFFWLNIVSNGMGMPVHIPVMVARGKEEGPVVGITAAVHGNELNGIPIIQRLFRELAPEQMRGTVVGVPVVNVPSLLRQQRRFIDGVDLNHIMPGKPNGNVSEVYANRFIDRIVRHFDYLIDLHTASFGRINSYYIRADLNEPVTRTMAMLQNAHIVVHNPPSDGTLRGAANALGVHAVTLEVGDPNTFQKGLIRSGLTGIHNLLVHLEMTNGHIEEPVTPPIVCNRSYWIYTDAGGILTVLPRCTDFVRANERVAYLNNVFGDRLREYETPEEGVVIGKSVSPINQTGGRILHLGLLYD